MKTLQETNQKIADFMGFVYKGGDHKYSNHHIQEFNKDGTPKRPDGTRYRETGTCWTLWYPHAEWNHFMPVFAELKSRIMKLLMETGTEIRYPKLSQYILDVDLDKAYVELIQILILYNHYNERSSTNDIPKC